MADDAEPPRKFYDFKPKEFERVNPPRPPAPEPHSTSGGAEGTVTPGNVIPFAPPADEKINVHDLIQHAQTTGPFLFPKGKPAGPLNEVHGILRDNHARADEAGLFAVSTAPRRPSRRRRDYWGLMIVATLFFGAITGAGFFQQAPVLFVYGIAGLIIVNVGLWWVMWHVMDDY